MGTIVVADRTGAANAFSAFHYFFSLQDMIPAGGTIGYPGGAAAGTLKRGGGAIAYGSAVKGDVREDGLGMTEAKELGHSIAGIISRFKESGII